MTRTLTRIDGTHPRICGNRSRNSRFLPVKNVHTRRSLLGEVVMQETWVLMLDLQIV